MDVEAVLMGKCPHCGKEVKVVFEDELHNRENDDRQTSLNEFIICS